MSKNRKSQFPQQESLRSDFDREFDTELDWLAFQYVVGELSGEVFAEFESRLLGDQQAREAVAAAVELELALRAVGPNDFSRLTPSKPANQETGSLGKGLSVALLLVVAASLFIGITMIQFLRPSVEPHPAATERISSVTDVDDRLAVVWFETNQQSLLGEEVELTDAMADISVEEFGSLRTELEDEFSPDWMLAAVEADAEDDVTGLETKGLESEGREQN
jgi:hypothetical protein